MMGNVGSRDGSPSSDHQVKVCTCVYDHVTADLKHDNTFKVKLYFVCVCVYIKVYESIFVPLPQLPLKDTHTHTHTQNTVSP